MKKEEAENSNEQSAIDFFVGKKANYYKKKWKKTNQKNNSSFNASAFFFSFLWLGYRKYYKPVIVASIGFLLIDIILYFIGYQYPLVGISPIDQGIGISMSVLFGMYGNTLYKKYTKEKIQEIDNSTNDPSERKKLYQKKGGTSWKGILISIAIMFVIYIIPSSFVPTNFDPVDLVKTSSIEYVNVENKNQEVKINKMFNRIFEEKEWNEINNNKKEGKTVQFTGVYDDKKHLINFNVFDDYTEITKFLINDQELSEYTNFKPFDYLVHLYHSTDK